MVKSFDDIWHESLLVARGPDPDRLKPVPVPGVAPVDLMHRWGQQVSVLGRPKNGAAEPQTQLFPPVEQRGDVQPLECLSVADIVATQDDPETPFLDPFYLLVVLGREARVPNRGRVLERRSDVPDVQDQKCSH